MNLFSLKKNTKQTNDTQKKTSILSRLKTGLSKTRTTFVDGVQNTLLGKKEINQDILEEIETHLLTADVGVAVTEQIIDDLTKRLKRKELDDGTATLNILKSHLTELLVPVENPFQIDSLCHPYIILMVGVNGSGKTTTIGKLAKQLQSQGKKVMLAAGDTFRAAAVDQLQVWGERNQVPVIAQQPGADSAAVIFDAIQSAKAHNIDVLIADTAGRLHTQTHLMEELKKITRVIKKVDDHAPHEVMLVLDAGIGQNALQQAKQFNQAIGVTGITFTKLDGTAKGGIIFAIAQALQLPIRFIGIGEQIDDLQTFHANEFVNALLGQEQQP